MRRLALLVVSVAVLLVVAGPAVAKEGAMLSPDLDAVAPGRSALFQLLVMPLFDHAGRVRVPGPRAGTVPVVVLRSRQTGEVVRFVGTRLSGGGEGGRLAGVRITIPVRRTQQTWKISVTAAGRSYPDLMQGDLIVVKTLSAASTAGRGAVLVWPLVGVGLLVIVLAGALIGLRLRVGVDDPDLGLPPPDSAAR